MENQVIRIGSVGVGGIWSGVHEPGIRKSPNLELVAICDIDREKLDAVGEKYGIPAERRVYGLPRPDPLSGCGRSGHLHVERRAF